MGQFFTLLNRHLTQASFVSVYIMYLTWSALTNQPNKLCKSDLTEIFIDHGLNGINDLNGTVNFAKKVVVGAEEHPSMDTSSIVGLVVWFCCVLYSSIRYFFDLSLQAQSVTVTFG